MLKFIKKQEKVRISNSRYLRLMKKTLEIKKNESLEECLNKKVRFQIN